MHLGKNTRAAISLMLLFFMVEISPVTAEEKLPPLSLNEFLSIRYPMDLSLSPDGKAAAFTLTWADFEKNIYQEHVWLAGSSGQARQITFGSGRDRMPLWSSDGRYLAFLSTRDRPDKTGEGEFQIYLLPLSGGEAWRLTDAPGGILEYQWSPDGKSLIYIAEESPPAAAEEIRADAMERHDDAEVHDSGRKRGEVRKITLEGDDRLLFAGFFGMKGLTLSPDGRKAAFATNLTGDPDDVRKTEIWFLDLYSGQARQVTRLPGMKWNTRWSPDGRNILFLAYFKPPVEYGRPDIFAVSYGGGVPVNITGKNDIEVEDFRWPEGGNKIYFRGLSGTASHIYSIDPDGRGLVKISPGEKVVGPFDLSRDGKVLSFFQEDAVSGPDLFLKDARSGEPEKISDLNPLLKKRRIFVQKTVSWRSSDGRMIEGVLALPSGSEKKRPFPTLVYLHGGPYGVVQNTLRDREFQVWASREYAVLAPNFRGSAGYGHEFAFANRGDLGGRDLEDILSGIDFLVNEGIADPQRLACIGGSYGGYLTNWLIARTDRFKAAVSMYGIFSFLTDASCSSMPTFELDYFGKWYWEELDPYLERSPMKYVRDIKTPVLILHGEEDDNTFIANSLEMYTALKKLGRTVEFVRYPREGHGFEEPVHQADALRRSLSWINRHVFTGGERPPRLGGEEIEQGLWRLKVLSAETVPGYSGIEAGGKFLEIRFLLESRGCDTPPWDIAPEKDVSFILPGGTAYPPAGIVVESPGDFTLLRGRNITVSSVGREGGSRALALRLAFDIPKDLRRGTLRVKDMPPVEIEISIIDKHP